MISVDAFGDHDVRTPSRTYVLSCSIDALMKQTDDQFALPACLRPAKQGRLTQHASGSQLCTNIAADQQGDRFAPSGAVCACHTTPNTVSAANRVGEVDAKAADWQLQVSSWSFDVYAWAQSRPSFFSTLVMELLRQEGLLGWKIPVSTMRLFLERADQEYQPNPYHNAAHAADVTQAVTVMLQHTPANAFSQLQRLALLLAAAVHDLGHPGVSNEFLVATRDHWALVYNDVSVNENMHVSRAIMLAEDVGLFSEMSASESQQVRRMMVSLVLSTDMSQHFALLDVWKQRNASEPDCWAWQDQTLVLSMLLHLADIANPARAPEAAIRWGSLIVQEFMAQGKREADLGLPVTPVCRPVSSPAHAQLTFCSTFLEPTLAACECLMPAFVAMARNGMRRSEAAWRQVLAGQDQDGRSAAPAHR